MFFTDGKLRPYEQLMRQSPRRPPSNKKQKEHSQPLSKSRPKMPSKEQTDRITDRLLKPETEADQES